jgi:hypothetical protein
MRTLSTFLACIALGGLAALGGVGGSDAAASSGCGWAYTVQEGIGGVTGSVLARHTLQSDFCWTDDATSDGANTLHTTDEVGWTSLPLSVTTQGNTMAKVGPQHIGTAYAKAEFCIAGPLGGCSVSDTYIKHTLLPNGMVNKTVPAWSV